MDTNSGISPLQNLLSSWIPPSSATPPDIVHVEDGGFVDFTLGTPSPMTFPVQEVIEAAKHAISFESLAYGPDQGSEQLRVVLKDYIEASRGISAREDMLLVTNGAMEGIAIAAQAFLEKDDVVLLEDPTYYRASHIFRTFGAQLYPIPLEHDGLDIEQLGVSLQKLVALGKTPKILYTIPNHQNPTGAVLAFEKRKALVELASTYNFVVLEDDVYYELTYDGKLPPSLFELDKSGYVFQLGSLSKITCPGIRIGWILGPSGLIDRFASLKADGGANPLTSSIALYLFNTIDWNSRIQFLQEFYRKRRDSVAMALAKIPNEYLLWNEPKGGFFIWMTLTTKVDPEQFVLQSSLRKVRLLSGRYCSLVSENAQKSFRLAFCFLEPRKLEDGVNKIADAIRYSHLE